MSIRYFDRYELKYIIDRLQYQRLVEAVGDFMTPDDEGDAHGRYGITSLYYDTVDYKAYWDKIEGHRFRRKVRVRVYGNQTVTSDTKCFAEIKQRLNKTLQKKRVLLPYTEALALCSQGESVETNSEWERKIVDEIRYLHDVLQLQPACIVSYDRLAFNGDEYNPGLRVTFDTNLKGRAHDLDLRSPGQAENKFFILPTWSILEVKVNHRVPAWLAKLINRHGCTLRRISKYCTALEQSKALLQTQYITQ